MQLKKIKYRNIKLIPTGLCLTNQKSYFLLGKKVSYSTKIVFRKWYFHFFTFTLNCKNICNNLFQYILKTKPVQWKSIFPMFLDLVDPKWEEIN